MTIWSRVWPPELLIHQSNPKAIPLASGAYPHLCPNCGGNKLMMVYVIDGGPYQNPAGKVKWLDLPPDPPDPQTPNVSGWYSGRLEAAPCPVCADGGHPCPCSGSKNRLSRKRRGAGHALAGRTDWCMSQMP